jgi:hypothetical protein
MPLDAPDMNIVLPFREPTFSNSKVSIFLRIQAALCP